MKKTTRKDSGKALVQQAAALIGIGNKYLQPLVGEKLAPSVRDNLSPLVRELTNVDYGWLLSEIKERITIKAKDFANEISNFNIKQNELRTESRITDEHVRNNQEVRQLLVDRGIVPETLPPAEDVKKVERRLTSEQKKLTKKAKPLESHNEETE